jgi:hypothetical protein
MAPCFAGPPKITWIAKDHCPGLGRKGFEISKFQISDLKLEISDLTLRVSNFNFAIS